VAEAATVRIQLCLIGGKAQPGRKAHPGA